MNSDRHTQIRIILGAGLEYAAEECFAQRKL